MEIVLETMDPSLWPAPAGWTVVGRVGPYALAYDTERRPFLFGDGEPMAVDPEAVNAALAPAVDAAADRLWPGGWMPSFAEAFAVDKRGLSASRLARQGLPPPVLFALANTAGHHAPEALGALLLALARYTAQASAGSHFSEQIEDTVHEARNAAEILGYARRGKPVWQDRAKGLVKE